MAQKQSTKKQVRPPQHQNKQPGVEAKMRPAPRFEPIILPGEKRLEGKTALITGGDSGIGRAVAVLFAAHGADVAIIYLNENEDAEETNRLVEEQGSECLLLAGDLKDQKFCAKAVKKTIDRFGQLDVLVNNAAEQFPQEEMSDITSEQLDTTFRTNIFPFFFVTQAALPHMGKGSSIINTTSVTAYRGSPGLLDYSSTKGAIVSFTRSLAHMLVKKGIRVNAVAPGPVWTPLIVSTFPKDKVATFGSDVPLGRPGEPNEIAPCYLFLASAEASYITGQVLHPNGGEIVNG